MKLAFEWLYRVVILVLVVFACMKLSAIYKQSQITASILDSCFTVPYSLKTTPIR